MAIHIHNTADWQALKEKGLNLVTDPMVLRCGELFLSGASAAKDKAATWQLLSKNIHSISTFFDALILNEQIPIFDFEATFMDQLHGFNDRVLTRINQFQEILIDVRVGYQVYEATKSAGIEELKKLYTTGETPKITKAFAEDIINELSVADYQWAPHLFEIEDQLESEEEKKLARFLLGGLIFTGYAQELEGHHLLQPKRSSLFLAASFQTATADYTIEEHLFQKLKDYANTPSDEIPWTPTFFPYLLTKVNSLEDMLKEVVKLRNSGMVQDYKGWLEDVYQDWEKDAGRIAASRQREVLKIAEAIKKEIEKSVKLSVSKIITLIVDVVTQKFGFSSAGDVYSVGEELFGWALSNIPGKRYQKLLTKAIVADNEYKLLDARVKQIWENN